MTEARDRLFNEFRPHDAVRLLERHGAHPAGAACRVVGRFGHAGPTYIVSFEDEHACLEVGPAEIFLADLGPTAPAGTTRS